MALTKTATQALSNVTVTASGSQTGTGLDLSAAVDFGIGYAMTFHASATQGARIDLYADATGAGGTGFSIGTYDDPIDSFDIAVDPGHAVFGFAQFQRAAKYVKAKLVNVDTGQSITLANLYYQVQTP